MTSQEFEKLFNQVSDNIYNDFRENAVSRIIETLHGLENENGKIDLQNSQIGLTAFAINSSMEFTKTLLYDVLQKIFVNE